MTRPVRVSVDGGVYHVYNRLARGERVFEGESEAAAFVAVLREVVARDGLTVLAWCLMGSHYHLALRLGNVPLNRPMRSLQQRVTHGVNAQRRVWGPLWQGRFRAKLVQEQRYLDRLLVYIHLNPQVAGLVADPAEYRWSGHRELLGMARDPIVDVDEVLRLFGTSRRSARAAYVRQLKGAAEEEWVGESPGRLPWWRLGRPPKEEDDDPETAVRARRGRGRGAVAAEDRPSLGVEEFLERGMTTLGVEASELRGRGKTAEIVKAREALAVVGVERYGLRVVDLARVMGKSPDTITKAIGRATRRRVEEPKYPRVLDRLDKAVTSGGDGANNGGMA